MLASLRTGRCHCDLYDIFFDLRVISDRNETQPLIHRVAGACHASYSTEEEAQRIYDEELAKGNVKILGGGLAPAAESRLRDYSSPSPSLSPRTVYSESESFITASSPTQTPTPPRTPQSRRSRTHSSHMSSPATGVTYTVGSPVRDARFPLPQTPTRRSTRIKNSPHPLNEVVATEVNGSGYVNGGSPSREGSSRTHAKAESSHLTSPKNDVGSPVREPTSQASSRRHRRVDSSHMSSPETGVTPIIGTPGRDLSSPSRQTSSRGNTGMETPQVLPPGTGVTQRFNSSGGNSPLRQASPRRASTTAPSPFNSPSDRSSISSPAYMFSPRTRSSESSPSSKMPSRVASPTTPHASVRSPPGLVSYPDNITDSESESEYTVPVRSAGAVEALLSPLSSPHLRTAEDVSTEQWTPGRRNFDQVNESGHLSKPSSLSGTPSRSRHNRTTSSLSSIGSPQGSRYPDRASAIAKSDSLPALLEALGLSQAHAPSVIYKEDADPRSPLVQAVPVPGAIK